MSVYFHFHCSVWDIETGTDICTFDNHAEGEKVTALEYINPHDLTYLMTGTGTYIYIRVYLSVYLYMYKYAETHTCTPCMHMYMHAGMHAYTLHIHMYEHTYT